ncbi:MULTISPECIES: sulfotransferase [unclassified Lysobacter]|uniref:sulfotransferase family protein n=1 Tax=unclassified Lysobacter TaxID=2635362 RepID=UPI001BEA27A5|nr:MULTISPECIES: sulfotransferase [unclassified Lysobacter]MBT2748706.1 sulfotransferase [Lysobacter sp. ISL-42]MBT2751641.1 sulfotransferase [Lysobacter sp. ISL-50]MBT2775835.1 sulfotransferase [Lysobacter sp. ISL-54]MBT2782200.1 sulfotransferase [Lysobacter sp. ISL-52]
MRPVHFISGLPRSGSTLLAALLRQNPRFHAHMSGPLAGMVDAMLGEMSGRSEFSVFITDEQRQRVLRGLFASYYGAEFATDVIFDTSRTWCSKLPVLSELFPDFKIIACVRNLSWIVDSLERAVQKNALSPSFMFNFQTAGTVYNRTEGIASGDGILGHSFNGLKEAFYGEHARHLMLLQYETLARDPARAMSAVYDFIGMPLYQHDFENVQFDVSQFDAHTGMPGLHAVGRKVAAPERKTVLPPDIFRRFENEAFWLNRQANIRGVRVV